jgi:hypothetical protein
VRTEERGAHGDGALAPQRARRAQLLALVFEREAVARLDLDGGHALGQQRVQARQAGRDQVRFAGRARRLHRREDAATGTRDGFITDTVQALLELLRAIAGVHEVGVAVDETRRDPAAFAVDDLERVELRGCTVDRPRIGDAPVATRDESVVDDSETFPVRRHRRESGIPPDPITTHDGNIYCAPGSTPYEIDRPLVCAGGPAGPGSG